MFYIVGVVCFNCRVRGRVVIRKGNLIAVTKCPKCGCTSLNYAHEEEKSPIYGDG